MVVRGTAPATVSVQEDVTASGRVGSRTALRHRQGIRVWFRLEASDTHGYPVVQWSVNYVPKCVREIQDEKKQNFDYIGNYRLLLLIFDLKGRPSLHFTYQRFSSNSDADITHPAHNSLPSTPVLITNN